MNDVEPPDPVLRRRVMDALVAAGRPVTPAELREMFLCGGGHYRANQVKAELDRIEAEGRLAREVRLDPRTRRNETLVRLREGMPR